MNKYKNLILLLLILITNISFAADKDSKEVIQKLKTDSENKELLLRDIKNELRRGSCLNYLIPKMLNVIEVPGYVPDYNRPKPRPELESQALRDIWESIVENGTGSPFLKRLLEIRSGRSLLIEGKLYNKIKSHHEIEIKEGLYQVGENLDNWVRLTNRDGKRFMMRTPMSRAQVFEILGYDTVRTEWNRLTSEHQARETSEKLEHWRQLNIPMDQWGDYPATFLYREDLKKILTAIPGWRLPTAFEYEIAARAGRTKPITVEELKKQVIYSDNSMLEGNAGDKCGNNRKGLHTMSEVDDNPWGFEGTQGGVVEYSSEIYVGANQRQRGTKKNPLVDPEGVPVTDQALEEGAYHAVCGGGWNSFARYCEPFLRDYGWGGTGSKRLGLRLVRIEKNNP